MEKYRNNGIFLFVFEAYSVDRKAKTKTDKRPNARRRVGSPNNQTSFKRHFL